METRQIDSASSQPASKHELSIIQGELKDIRELLAMILVELQKRSPSEH